MIARGRTGSMVRRIIANFSGRCKGCGSGILEGETIIWSAGEGIWHPKCYEQRTLSGTPLRRE